MSGASDGSGPGDLFPDPSAGFVERLGTSGGSGSVGGEKQSQFDSNNSKTFQSSNLNQPSSASEGWRKLSGQLTPSEGSGSGDIDTKSINNDAQWIRAFSLIVYSHATTAGGTVGTPHPANVPAGTPPRPAGGRVIPFPPRPTTRDDPAVSSQGDTTALPLAKQSTQQPALDISNLRCTFSIQKTTLQTPNMLYARIYNLAPATLAKVLEFTRVQVHAGYKYANYGRIFDGEVVQYRRGKENPVDTYLEIHAADGDTINTAVQFQAYPAGTKERKILDDLNTKKKEIDPSFKVEHVDESLYTAAYQRDSVVVGHARAVERRMFLSSGAQHFIEMGAFIAIKNEGYRPGETVILSPKTGLVGMPEVTPQGIQVKCLLNPKLVLGGVVQINSDLISGVAYTPGTDSKTVNGQVVPGDPTGGKVFNTNMWKQNLETAYTSPVGKYKILLMTYTGDTRGNPWYCDLVCVALDSNGNAIVRSNTSNAWVRRASQQATQGTQGSG
jgi:baseplate hub protein gp41